MPATRVNGVELYYEVYGKGLPVLFIHGGTGGPLSTLAPRDLAASTWYPLDGVMLLQYDRRSAGRSEYVMEPYTLTDLAGDGRALLDHLGLARAVVIGNSMGGMVAIQLALLNPDRVVGLGLLATGAALMSEENLKPGGKGLVGLGRKVREFRALGARPFFETDKQNLRTVPALSGVEQAPPGREMFREDMRARYIAALAETSDEDLYTYSTGTLRNGEAYYGIDLLPRLQELRMPVCIIHGTADTNVPFAFAAEMRERLPRAQFHAIEGGTHGILLYPEAVAALRAWLTRLVNSAACPDGVQAINGET